MDSVKEVLNFIEEFWGEIPESKKNIHTTLSDLGFFGDDKRELLEKFFEKYNINKSSFNYSKYIEQESGFLWTSIKSIFSREKHSDIVEIKISHMVNALIYKAWAD